MCVSTIRSKWNVYLELVFPASGTTTDVGVTMQSRHDYSRDHDVLH